MEKEGEMLNFKLFMLLAVAVFIGLASSNYVTAGDSQKININTATAEELVQLNGIGPKYAANIVEYRETWGSFKTPEDLMHVPGIGQKTFEKNKDLIILKEPEKTKTD